MKTDLPTEKDASHASALIRGSALRWFNRAALLFITALVVKSYCAHDWWMVAAWGFLALCNIWYHWLKKPNIRSEP